MRCGVVVFPGSNCDHDAYHVLKHVLEQDVTFLWHQDEDLQGCDLVVLPGGFSYGDYLRAGAMASLSPVMAAVKRHAEAGGLVLGICNGFQVLLEAGLLPGAMRRNANLRFQCRDVYLKVERNDLPFTRKLRGGPGPAPAHRPRRGELRGRAGEARRPGGRRPGGLPLRDARTALVTPEAESERLGARDRGHLQRARQRARPDAPPGALLRGDPRATRTASPCSRARSSRRPVEAVR